MTVEPNDPRLTALLLGELTDAERAALEAKVAASEPLSESVEGVRQTVEVLRSELAAEACPHLSPLSAFESRAAGVGAP
jgi:anti-sigma factor RsiW